MKEKIINSLKENIKIKNELMQNYIDNILDISYEIIQALKKDKKLLIFGNGGSAADSQHMAAELIGRFKKERKAIPAIALNTNTSTISSLANDYDYSVVFSRQIEALGNEGDIALGISTSGNSANIIEAVKISKEKGLITIGLTGESGGRLAKLCDLVLRVPSNQTPRIQEVHITCIHIICDLIESELYKD